MKSQARCRAISFEAVQAPYVFTGSEVTALMQAAGRLSRRLPAATYQALMGMLAVTGMRPGEAYALDRDDVDLDAGTVTITSSKNGVCRQLPPAALTARPPAGLTGGSFLLFGQVTTDLITNVSQILD